MRLLGVQSRDGARALRPGFRAIIGIVTSIAGEGIPTTPGQVRSDGAPSANGPMGGFNALRAAADRALRRLGRAGAVVRAMRPLHWVKNLLLFVPLFEGHQTDLAQEIGPTVLAFVAFCLCASGVYVVNDLADLQQDRCHPRKRYRPIAAGELSPRDGLVVAAVLSALGFGVAVFAPRPVTHVLCAYWLGTLAYTLVFRQIAVLDVVCLAAFFTLRVLAGALAASEQLIPWLFVVAGLGFLSLAFLKRTVELRIGGESDRRALHVYGRPNLRLLALAGKACGCLALLVSAAFIPSEYARAIYSHPERLCLLLLLVAFWLFRMWSLADRGRVDEDPVVFVVGDRTSHAVAVAAAAITWLAI
jgi:4-hydroxybenzoate polyprenyltransferase